MHMEKTDFGRFSQKYQFWVEHQSIDRLLSNVRKLIPADGVILDAGCGDGTLSVALAPYARQLVGFDLAPEMIALAQQKARVAGAHNIHFFIGDLQQYTVKDQCFDMVVSSFALHHTPIEKTLPLLTQTVKPGGWLVIQEPSCPVNGALRPLWYRWQGLRIATAAFQAHGISTGLQVGHFHQSGAWINHQLADNHLNTGQWREVVTRLLPDAAFQHTADQTAVVILWQRPLTTDNLHASRFQPPASGSEISQSTIQVARRYPLPVTADYIPFPRSAIEDSVVARFEAQVILHKEHVALRTTERKLTYSQLNADANRVAWRLLSLSRADNIPVAILMEKDEHVIPALFGTLKAGKAYVVLNPADTPEQQARVILMAGAETLLTTASRLESIRSLLDNALHQVIWEELDSSSDTNPELLLGPDHLAAIFFTSGSTGKPKGVARDHRQFLHSTWLNTNTYYVSSSDRQSLLYFPGFTASVPNIYDTLLNGATLCSLNANHITPSELLAWVRQERITHFNPPVGLWRELIRAIPQGTLWPHLRLVTLVGQPIYSKDIRDFQSLFGLGTVLLYVLAMTETGAVTQGYIDQSTVAGDSSVPVGYSLTDKDVTILDDSGIAVKAGEVGRVAVTSGYLSLGYWQDKERTDLTFRSDADNSSHHTFITSDRGRLRPDGCLEYFGREDSIIKIRGYRIDTTAIEAALNNHPQVTHAVVVTRQRIYGDVFLVAYLSGTKDSRPSTEALRIYLSLSLPHYMTPDRFAWLEELPLTASGKVNRQSLSLLSTPRPSLSEPFLAPRTKLEQQIAEIWAELLELDSVGVNDNFLELGGDSLLAMRMMQQVEQRIGVTPSSKLYRASTVGQLARLVLTSKGSEKMDHHFEGFTESAPKVMSIRRYMPQKMLRRLIRTGPIWRGHALSYDIGVRLHWTLMTQLWLHRRIFARQLEAAHKWRAELGAPQDDQVLKINLLANTWPKWRNLALTQPGIFKKWVTIFGEGKHLMKSPNTSCGIVFLLPHTGWMMSTLQRLFQAQERETAVVAIDLSIKNLGDTAAWYAQQTQSRTAQLWRAQQVLQRNGVVFIAGDGRQGNQSVDVPFMGRLRPFQSGAAWLAVMTDALFVPVFVTFDANGRVNMDVTAALVAEAGSKEEQVIELTEKYGKLYAKRWPQFYASMDWTHLLYNFNLPVI